MQQKIITHSAVETARVAKAVVRKFRGGEVLLLEGELGTGKTTFVRGLARALGYRGVVRSPTFTLLNVYPIQKRGSATKQLIHVDAYRIKSAADLRAIGIEEYLGKRDTVVIIEWGKKAFPLLRHFKLQTIIFTHGTTPNERNIAYVSI